MERRKFDSLQAGRGIAAMMVVLFHIGGFVGREPDLWQKSAIYRIFYAGLYGVDFFFILSGIVILSAHWNDLGKGDRVGTFLWKRIRRIYPIYWIFLVPTIVKQFATTDVYSATQRNPFVVLSSFLLIHVKSLGVNIAPSWTLFHEVLFYLLFTTVIYSKKLGAVVCSCWFAGSFFFFNLSAYSTEPDRYVEMLFSPLHLLFGFGLLAGWLLLHRRGPSRLWVLGSGVLVVVGGLGLQALHHRENPWLRTLVGAGITLTLLCIAEQEYLTSFKVPRLLTMLGDASYSIYLSHLMILSLIIRRAYHLDPAARFPIAGWITIFFLVAVGFGVAAHFWIERPLLRWMGGRAKPAMEIPLPTSATA